MEFFQEQIYVNLREFFLGGRSMIFKKRNFWELSYFVVLFVFFSIFRFFLILCSDDFFWVGDKGQYLLHHFFVGDSTFGGSGNGRYLGSIFEIYSVRHEIIGIIIYAIFLTALVYLIYRLTQRTFLSLILASLGILLLPSGLFSDVIAWNAAFVNYVPPMVTALTFLLLNKLDVDDKKVFRFFLLIIMFCGQLFLESMTIYQVLMVSAVIAIRAYVFRVTVKKYNYFALVGTLFGALLMAINPSYYMIGNSSYRRAAHGIFQVIHNYIFQTHFYFLTYNFLLNSVLIFSFIIILYFNKNIRFRKLLISILIAYLFYFVFISRYIDFKTVNSLFMINHLSLKVAYLDTVIMTLFWFLILLLSLYVLPSKNKRETIFCQISGGVTAGPYLIVLNPLRVREYFGNYIFMLLLTLIVFNFSLELIIKNTDTNLDNTRVIGLIIVGLVSLNLLLIMGLNHHVNTIRTGKSSWLYGNAKLSQHVPYRNYVKNLDMKNAQFKFYYRERKNMSFFQKILH